MPTYAIYPEHYLKKNDFPRVKSPLKYLIIASTPRSGSYMLAHALHVSDHFGFPLEYANPGFLPPWKQRLGTKDLFDTIEELKRIRTSPNGVFGIKLHYSHIEEFGGMHIIERIFPNAFYIFLDRTDVVSQAVSWSIASQTGVWFDGQEPICTTPVYSYRSIQNRLRKILIHSAEWRYILATRNCKCLHLNFEWLRRNIADGIELVGSFLGIQIPREAIPVAPVTKRQSTELNRQWKDRFLSEFSGEELLMSYRKLHPSVRSRVLGFVKRGK